MFHLETHEKASTFFAFGILGVLQGAVYGHANVALAKALSISKPLSVLAFFRGSAFGFGRDLISQGIPFYFGSGPLDVVGWSLLSTVASHPLHLAQTLMQADGAVRYRQVPSRLRHQLGGVHVFTSGISARLGLLTVTNLLNHYLFLQITY